MATPSEDIISAGVVTATVSDEATGRQITIQKLMPLDRMRLAELVGANNVLNDMYFGYASLAYHVIAIDNEKFGRPSTKANLEFMVKRLGDSGLVAVGKGIADNFITKDTSEDDDKAAVKNASSTPS